VHFDLQIAFNKTSV